MRFPPIRPRSGGSAAASLLVPLAMVVLSAVRAAAANGDCGQPISSGSGPNASDCSYVLKAAVGQAECDMCVCDINGNNKLNTTDALICLKKAVGQGVSLDCPTCGPTTTGPQSSTTSTSTTSTTTTIPVRCQSEGDCSALPDTFRCNPNNETCEKPCTKNADCHDFYECNTTTGFCQEPALIF